MIRIALFSFAAVGTGALSIYCFLSGRPELGAINAVTTAVWLVNLSVATTLRR